MTYSRSIIESAPVLSKVFQEVEAVFGRSVVVCIGVRYTLNGVLISSLESKVIDLAMRHFRRAGWGYSRQEDAVRVDRPDTLTQTRHALTSEERFNLMPKPTPDQRLLRVIKPVSPDEVEHLINEFNRNFPEIREGGSADPE
jgi:hypothetical protein